MLLLVQWISILQNDAIGKDKDGNDVFLQIFGQQLKKLMKLLNKQLHRNYSVKNMKMYLLITNVGMKLKQVMIHFIHLMKIQHIFKTHHSLKDYQKNQVTVKPLNWTYV